MRPRANGKSKTRFPAEAALKPLGRRQHQALEAYTGLVRRWNRAAKLVANADLNRFFHRHVLDSLSLAPLIRRFEGLNDSRSCDDASEANSGSRAREGTQRQGQRSGSGVSEPDLSEDVLPIADFGSGAGLPGLPLAIALPMLPFLLVERSERKARFLQRARDELALRNVQVRCMDVKNLPPRSCRAVVARAVMPPSALWEQARAATVRQGYLLVLDRVVPNEGGAPSAAGRLPRAPSPTTTDNPLAGCATAKTKRHWIEMLQLGAWHGVLEIRRASPWQG